MKNGFSLIELMVSSLIGVIMMGLFFNVFLDNLRYVSYNENRSALQNAAQHALFYIKHDLSRAALGITLNSEITQYATKTDTTLPSSQDLKTMGSAVLGQCESECNSIDLCTAFSRNSGTWNQTFNKTHYECVLKRGDTGLTVASTNLDLFVKPQNYIVAVGDCGSVPCTGEGIGVDNSDVVAVLLDPQNDRDCANNPWTKIP